MSLIDSIKKWFTPAPPPEPKYQVKILQGGINGIRSDNRGEQRIEYLDTVGTIDSIKTLLTTSIALGSVCKKVWQGVIIHHSLTKDGKVVDEKAITRYHTSWRTNGNIITSQKAADMKKIDPDVKIESPWIDCGYHFIIEEVIEKEVPQIIVWVCRPLDTPGAHCSQRDRNRTHIGLCFVGNYDNEVPSNIKLQVGAAVVKGLMNRFKFGLLDIEPHRMHAPKTCPGTQFDIDKFTSLI
jgi:hypothetical protein